MRQAGRERWGFFLFAVLLSLCRPLLGHAATIDCRIEPYVVVTVSTPVEGLVESVLVDRGDMVTKGQVVATLESSVERAAAAVAKFRAEIQAPLKASQERIEFTARKVARAEELSKKETVSRHELDEAQTEHRLAQMNRLEAMENRRLAELESERASALLALRTIRTPVAGVVVERFSSPGEFRNNLQPWVLKIAQLDPLRIEASLPVSLHGQVKPEMSAVVHLVSPTASEFSAHITVVDKVINPASGYFGIRLEVPNPDYQLPAGLPCKLTLPDR